MNPLEQTLTKPEASIKYCLYTRKSSESDEKQALSIESQKKEMLSLAQREGISVIRIYEESHSAKATGMRPVFNEMIEDIQKGTYDGILAWHPDRLSRNAGDLGKIVDFIDQEKIREVRTHGQRFTNNPSEKFLLMILGSQAKLENDNKSINVKRGMRTRCEMGLWPAPAPTGYLKTKNKNDSCKVFVDPVRAPAIKEVFEKIAYENFSGRKAYNWLTYHRKFKTVTGKSLSLGNFYRLIKQPFYYGEFEYPSNSGNWYKGAHTPITTKEVFSLVQEKISVEYDFSYASKEFAFTRLLTCGSCGSGVSAQEKVKRQKNGNVHKYIYYGCNRSRNKECKEPYIREENLIEEICEMIEELEVSKLGIQRKMREEVARFGEFQKITNGSNEQVKVRSINIKGYLKYLLKNGSILEKRSVLENIEQQITLQSKKLSI